VFTARLKSAVTRAARDRGVPEMMGRTRWTRVLALLLGLVTGACGDADSASREPTTSASGDGRTAVVTPADGLAPPESEGDVAVACGEDGSASSEPTTSPSRGGRMVVVTPADGSGPPATVEAPPTDFYVYVYCEEPSPTPSPPTSTEGTLDGIELVAPRDTFGVQPREPPCDPGTTGERAREFFLAIAARDVARVDASAPGAYVDVVEASNGDTIYDPNGAAAAVWVPEVADLIARGSDFQVSEVVLFGDDAPRAVLVSDEVRDIAAFTIEDCASGLITSATVGLDAVGPYDGPVFCEPASDPSRTAVCTNYGT